MNKLPKDSLWKEFKFADIFNIKCGFYNKKPNSEKNGKIPFIGATEYNNGITEFYSYENILNTSKTGKEPNESIERKIFPGNCLCVTNNGSVGFAYYQKIPFTCTHDVNPLYLKDYKLNKYIAMFLIATIEKQRVCFMYARKWRPCRMVKSKLLLPVNSKGEPDYKFMEEYIKERENKFKEQYKEHTKKLVVNLKKRIDKKVNWNNFPIADIFNIKSGKRLTKADMKIGNIPFISAADNNNGVTNFISNLNESLDKNVLGVNYDGNGGMVISFYHPYDCIFSDSVKRFHFKNTQDDKYVFLFTKVSILKQRDKYRYGYKFNETRMKKQQIMLPVDSKGEPDYEFMHNYMLYLEQKKILEYLEYVDE